MKTTARKHTAMISVQNFCFREWGHMMKKESWIRMVVMIMAAMTFILSGCNQTETETADDVPVFNGKKIEIAAEVLADYPIVRGDTAEQAEVNAAIALRDGLKAVGDLTLTTDWIKRGEEVPAGLSEILVGMTNRTETLGLYESLRNRDFAIAMIDQRIVIVGGSADATGTAVEFFVETFVDDEAGVLYVPEEPFIYHASYPIDEILLNGISVKEYKIFGESPNTQMSAEPFAAQLADTLSELTGNSMEAEQKQKDGRHIRFTFDETLGDNCTVYTDGEDLCVAAADTDAMTCAYAYLCDEVLSLNDLSSKERSINITDPLIFDLTTVKEREPYIIYVSPNGTEDGDGTAEKPFATLQAAVDTVRYARRLQPTEIVLDDGDYYFSETVQIDALSGGSRYASLTIRAKNSGKVRLLGGVSVDPALCQAVTDPAILDRVIDSTAAKNLMMLDISAIAKEFPSFQDTNPVEVFFDGTALTRSRWPNASEGDGYLRAEEILSVSEENYRTEPATFTYTDAADRAAAYWSEEGMSDLYILSYLGFDWYSDLLRVTSMDAASKTVTTEIGGTYLPLAGNRFFFCNILEEIDEPGESYIDRKNGIVYYYPYAASANEVFISTLNDNILQLDGCTNVILQGLSFAYSRQNPIQAKAVDTLMISDCNVSCIADNAMELDGYRITVDGCEVSNMWSGGIYVTGGDRVNLISSENEIRNCEIHDVNRSRVNYKPGVRADSVGMVVRNNVFYNAIHMMVGIHNNNVKLEYNEFYNCATDCSDIGAVYFGRDPSLMGIEIAYNYFHDIGNNYGGFGQQAIFMDDGNAGAYVHHNLFYRATTDAMAVKFHAAQYAVVEHNIFAEAPSAVYNGAWTYTDGAQYQWLAWIYDLVEERMHNIQDRIAVSGMESDLWREYYSGTQWEPLYDHINDTVREKVLAAHPDGAVPAEDLNISVLEAYAPIRSNTVADNVFVNIDSYDETGSFITGGIMTEGVNVPVTEDAFVDYGKDFTLTDDALAAIREQIPDFENFPMEKIGPGGNG